MDRLSPLSYDSGFHSGSSPATPHKNKQQPTVIMRVQGSPARAVVNEHTAALPLATVQKFECAPEAGSTAMGGCGWFATSSTSPAGVDKIKEETQEVPSLENPSSTVSQGSATGQVKAEVSEETCIPTVPSTSQLTSKEVSPCAEDVCCSLPSTSKLSLLLAKATAEISSVPSHLKEDEEDELMDIEDEDSLFTCGWKECKQGFPSHNHVYDHVIEFHITSARDSSTSDDEVVSCRWEKCKMSMARGDRGKKYNWLLEHYRSRHSKNAQPFKCVMEGCGERFSTTGKLEDHVRSQHINEPRKPKQQPQSKPISWGEWMPRRYWPRAPPGGGVPTWCRYYDHQLQMKLCQARDMGNAVTFEPRKRKGCGAEHRKAYGVTVYDMVPAKRPKTVDISPPEDSETPLHIVMEDTTTLDDLFPGWGYEEKKREESNARQELRRAERRKLRDEQRYIKWLKKQPSALVDETTST